MFSYNRGIESLEPLKGLVNLLQLQCDRNNIISLEPIRDMEKLEVLSTVGCPITSLEPIWLLRSLRKLMIRPSLKKKNSNNSKSITRIVLCIQNTMKL